MRHFRKQPSFRDKQVKDNKRVWRVGTEESKPLDDVGTGCPRLLRSCFGRLAQFLMFTACISETPRSRVEGKLPINNN